MAIQFALHCSPVRLALRVLNRTTRTRNHSRSPFTNATSRARLPTLTIAANAARTGRSQGGRTPTHAALSLLARARRTRLGFRIVQASTHRGLLDVKARVGKKDGVLQPRRYRGGMGNSPLCGSRRRTVVSLPARLFDFSFQNFSFQHLPCGVSDPHQIPLRDSASSALRVT